MNAHRWYGLRVPARIERQAPLVIEMESYWPGPAWLQWSARMWGMHRRRS